MDDSKWAEDCEVMMKGSFTVEASLNFGCAVFCLIFVLYMGMYLHDKTILECAASCAAQAGRMHIVENQRVGGEGIDWEYFEEKGLLWRLSGAMDGNGIASYAEVLSAGRLLTCDNPIFTVEIGADWVMVSYMANTRLNGIYLSGSGMAVSQISGNVTDSGMESEEFVRLVKAIVEER